jgi:fibronectin-binding autotransporter adhesin
MKWFRPTTRPAPSALAAVLAGLVLVAGALQAQTVYTWSAGDIVTGTITPSTVSTITAADTFNITTGNNHDFNGAILTNNGTVNWQAGYLRSGNGGTINNNAAWNDSGDGYQINNAYGGAGGTTFNNAATGTYTKTAGTTDFTIGFTNAGTISVTGGTLNLDAGGSFADGSVVGSSGSGVLQLLGGTLAMNGNITATNFLFNGGSLAGNQNLVGSTLTWQAGDWNSANTTTLAANTTLTVTSGNNHDFNSHVIVNNGTVNWVAGSIRSGNGGSITNSGMWNDASNGYQINDAYGGAGGTAFVNAAGGTYLKSAGTTDFLVGFTNYGTVSVTGGTLNLDVGGTFYGGSSIGSTGAGVVQLTGGLLTGAGAGGFTATNFVLTAGQVGDAITFLGTTSWVGSNFNDTGTGIIAPTGILNITSGNNHDFNSYTLVNNGTVNWTAGSVRSGNGGVLTNNGVWNDSSDTYQINDAYGGAGGTTFHNTATGVYNKTAGATTLADYVLVNDGTISVTGGSLSLVGGVLNNGSSIGSSGSGTVQLTAGVLTVNGVVNVQNFVLNGGELTGVQTFAGTLSWLNGDLNPAGSMTIGAGSALAIGTGNNHDYNAHAIVNNGTVNWTAGSLRSGNGGVLTNNAVWNDSSDTYQINAAYGGAGGSTFHNAATGVYNKTAGVTTLADGVLVNDGTITVTGGTLNLISGVLDNGSSIGSSGPGIVQLTAGVLTANGVVNVQNFLLNGGELTGTQTFNGSLSWLAGDLNLPGALTIGSTGTLTINTGNNHDFNAHQITNAGTVDWVAGTLRSGNGGTITNFGVWHDSSDTYQLNDAYGGAGGTTFVNATSGVYSKTGGATSILVPMVNLGLIDITGGSLALSGSYADAAGRLAVATGTTFSSSNALAFSTGSLLSGNGTVTAPGLAMSGAIKPGTTTSAGLLTLNGGLTLLAPAFTDFVIGGVTQGSQYDYLVVNGNLSLGGNLQVSFINGFDTTVANGMTFDLISSTSLSSTFLNAPNGSRLTTADGLGSFIVNYGAGSNFGVNDVVLSSFQPVPEPATWVLLVSGAGLLGLALRRRRA